MRFFKRRPEPATPEPSTERRSAIQIYLNGGGGPADARTMEILAKADRSHDRTLTDAPRYKNPQSAEPSPLHAHEITTNDAVMIRMMAGASFGPDAMVTLPSGRTITGAEMQRWLDAQEEG